MLCHKPAATLTHDMFEADSYRTSVMKGGVFKCSGKRHPEPFQTSGSLQGLEEPETPETVSSNHLKASISRSGRRPVQHLGFRIPFKKSVTLKTLNA